MERRGFLRMAAAAAALAAAPRSSHAAASRIDVMINEPIGPITPDFYGHFVEHLGGVVYDGVWVGEGSKIPNTHGIRQALIDAMRKLPKGAIRWPRLLRTATTVATGTDAEQRPRRTTLARRSAVSRPSVEVRYQHSYRSSSHALRLVGNAHTSPRDCAACRPATSINGASTATHPPVASMATCARRRREGSLKVRFWGVGNESWGCGGDFTAEEYAVEFRRFTSWVPGFDTRLSYIASGPSSGELDWTRGFFSKLLEKGPGMLGRVYGLALHHYSENLASAPRQDRLGCPQGAAVDSLQSEWYELLKEVTAWTADHEPTGPCGRVRSPAPRQARGRRVGHLVQAGTQVHPIICSDSRTPARRGRGRPHARIPSTATPTRSRWRTSRSWSTACSYAVPRRRDKFVTTPTYHVFDLYGPHVGGQAVRTLCRPRRSPTTGPTEGSCGA